MSILDRVKSTLSGDKPAVTQKLGAGDGSTTVTTGKKERGASITGLKNPFKDPSPDEGEPLKYRRLGEPEKLCADQSPLKAVLQGIGDFVEDKGPPFLRDGEKIIDDNEPENPYTPFLNWVDRTDVMVREFVDVLVERGSVLVLNQAELEREEAVTSAEMFAARTAVIMAASREERIEADLKELEAQVYMSAVSSNKGGKVTDIKAIALADPRTSEQRKALIKAREHRKLAEAYATALSIKIGNLPAACGLRNREYGASR